VKPRILFVLQNAWRHGARPGERDWNNASWIIALWRCMTGKRLREYIPDNVAYAVVNASRAVASEGKTVHRANLAHVAAAVHRYKPNIVVLLGREAQRLQHHLYNVRIVCLPHPCWRLLTKRQTAGYRDYLQLAAAVGGGMVNYRERCPIP